MSLEDNAMMALQSARSKSDQIAALKRAASQRHAAAASRSDHRTRNCPGCGHSLKLRAIPAENKTLMLCTGCNWNRRVDGMMTEAREFGEPYLPGVTGRLRGATTAVIGADGKMEIL